jgi:Kef-type K+ transport system membrane component KefB
MTQADLASLVVVLAASAGAVFFADAVRRFMIPLVVVEVLAGILVGPQVLGLAATTPPVEALARLGVCFLFFLAGFEIEVARLRGLPLRLGVVGWLLSLAIALGISVALHMFGLRGTVLPVGLALATTALGVLLPILRDGGVLPTPLGAATLGAGALGEFGPIVMLALFMGSATPLRAAAWLLLFVGLVVAAALVTRHVRPSSHLRLLQGTLSTSAQLVVRGSVLVLLVLVLLATRLGLDLLLGAFCAGFLVRLADPLGDATVLRQRMDAVGFGFLIPVFFVVTGMHFDLGAFAAGPAAALLLVAFVVAFFAVRGTPALLYRGWLGGRRSGALALLSATQLPLVVVIAAAAVRTGQMSTATASALIGAGMVTVVVFPLAALRILGASVEAPSAHDLAEGDAAPPIP